MLDPYFYLQKPLGSQTSADVLDLMQKRREELFYSPRNEKQSILMEMLNTLIETENGKDPN